jgi:hypothetical protein
MTFSSIGFSDSSTSSSGPVFIPPHSIIIFLGVVVAVTLFTTDE